MIANKKYYRLTKDWLRQYKTSVKLLNKYADVYDELYWSKFNSLKSQIEIMKKEIKEYEYNKQRLVE